MSATASGPYRIEVHRPDGSRLRLRVSAERTLLDGAERRGILLPFGCRRGTCATCAARLLEGRVEHRRPPRALKGRHLEEGYVLPCVALPRSDCALRVGSDVVAQLAASPLGGRAAAAPGSR